MLRVFNNPLYHGTIDQIDKIDLLRGKRRKDFGRGFYLAMNPRQAIGMMHKKRKVKLLFAPDLAPEAIVERLYRVSLKPSAAESLRIRAFEKVDSVWLDFILACRGSQENHPHGYDIVIGPTADDDTMAALKMYHKGLYGQVGSEQAKKVLLNVLEPENLGVQCCLCTPAAVEAVQSFSLVNWRMFA